MAGRFVFPGETDRPFAAGRSITMSGDPVSAGAWLPFAKGKMDALERQYLETGLSQSHTIGTYNGYIRFSVTPGRRSIHIEAGGTPTGEWVCLPTAEGNRGGFGPPFTDLDPESETFGELINEPMGTGSSEEGFVGPTHVIFGRKDREDDSAGWQVTARAQPQKYAMTDWKEPGLPIVTWPTIATGRYWPHRENFFPTHNRTYRHDYNYWYTGTKVWAGGTLLLNTEQLESTPYPIYGILGAALRVENAVKYEYRATSDQPGFPNFQWVPVEPQEMVPTVFLLLVVTDGYPIRRTWETWHVRVGEKDPETGEITFYKPVDSSFQAQPLVDPDPLEDGLARYFQRTKFSGTLPRHIYRSAQYGYKPGGRGEGSDQENLETLAKYGQPFYFAQPATKCSTFTIGRIFTVNWEWDGSNHFDTSLDIGEPEYDSGRTERPSTCQDGGGSYTYWVMNEKYLYDYGARCPVTPGSAKSAQENFINQVLSDNKTWQFKETVSGNSSTPPFEPFVRHTWEGVDTYLLEEPYNFKFEEVTGKATSSVIIYQATSTGSMCTGSSTENWATGTLAVDYQGQSLRKWTVESSSTQFRGGYISSPKPHDNFFNNCVCFQRNTFSSRNTFNASMTLEGIKTFSWSNSSQSPGTISGCGAPPGGGGGGGEDNYILLTFLYADMRGDGELFWWESTGGGAEGGINFAQIWRYPGARHTLKSHRDGTIHSG